MSLPSLHKEDASQVKAGDWVTVCSLDAESCSCSALKNTGSWVMLSQAGGWRHLSGPTDRTEDKTPGLSQTGPSGLPSSELTVHVPVLCSQGSQPVFSLPLWSVNTYPIIHPSQGCPNRKNRAMRMKHPERGRDSAG